MTMQEILNVSVGEETGLYDLLQLLNNVYNILPNWSRRLVTTHDENVDGVPVTLRTHEYTLHWKDETVQVVETEHWVGDMREGWMQYDTFLG